MCFNLFGGLGRHLALAQRALRAWWPDAPGTVCDVRFAHSPGRFDPAYLGNLIAFDVAFVLDLGDGTQGIVGVDTKYHESARRAIAKPTRLPRYREVAKRSGVFAPGAVDAVDRTDLLVMWLEHLLALSMLQHLSGQWRWARYVVLYPDGNSDIARACARYADLLVDHSTFSSLTIEALLDAKVLPARTTAALRKRYIAGGLPVQR
jgi:hypothetical protein